LNASLQDLGYALRLLRKNPGYAATAILTLALTIGVSTAVFSVIYAMLIKPLPYDHPERIVYLRTWSAQGYTQPASYPEYLDWRRENQVFSALAAYNDYGSANFEGPTGPAALSRVSVTDNFFDVFGVAPILGRGFSPGEDQPGKSDVVVLSYEIWREHLAAQPEALGRTIKLDGRLYTIVGVMPPGFRYPIADRDTVYTPLHPARKEQIEGRGNHWLPTIARLKPGVSPEQGEADMARILDNLGKAYPQESGGRRMQLLGIAGFIVDGTGPPLKVLSIAVLALLAIGCVNIAGLLVARGVKREREVALRSAVGASRARILRQGLTEAALLAIFGAFAGIVLSHGLLEAIRKLLIDALSRGAEVRINLPAMLSALGAAAVTAVAAAIAPSLRLSRIAPNAVLKSGGSAGTSRGQHRLRAAFVVTQVALSLVLLVTSGLLLRTLAGLRSADLGFSPDGLLTCEIALSPETYKGRDVLHTFYEPVVNRVKNIPGVESAGLIHMLPLREWGWNSDVHIVGQPPAPPNRERLAEIRFVTPGYFETMGISLVKGRLLDPKTDRPGSQSVMVVNEAFVKKFFSDGDDPIGKHIDDFEKAEIVGIVSDVRQDLYQPPIAEMDFGIAQFPAAELLTVPKMQLLVRTKVKPASVIPAIRRIFQELDPGLPFRQPETARDVMDEVLTFEQLENWLFGAFAALAVLLAMTGLYGLISHEVELCRRDIGVRMAVGATRSAVLGSIFRRVAAMLLAGLLCGLLLAFAGHRLISSVVAVRPAKDLWVVAVLAAGLFAVGILAALFPARSAAKVEPMVALRYE
jgi:putative ABC transport system permease protein